MLGIVIVWAGVPLKSAACCEGEDRPERLAEHDEPDQGHKEAEEQEDRRPRELHETAPRDEPNLREDSTARFRISCPPNDSLCVSNVCDHAIASAFRMPATSASLPRRASAAPRK